MPFTSRLAAAAVVLAGATAISLVPSDAVACGACFVPPTTPTVVAGHRMVLSVSPVQTVLWDQIQYQGDPEDFAWVLPVKPGARVEEAGDAFFEVLEATTKTTVTGQPVNCSQNTGDGCGNMFASASEAGDGSDFGGGEPDPVEVVHHGSVGPYETVTLSTEQPGALNQWLEDHGYAVDPTTQPVIDQYVAEGFDFIALRLLPGQGVKQMKPVRVVMPGGGLALPLRMVAIGTGAQTPIVLYLIGEGRYTVQNFHEVELPMSFLTWDYATSSSNYEQLRTGTLAQNGGKSFMTTFAQGRFFSGALGYDEFDYEPIDVMSLYADQAVSNGEATSCTLAGGSGKVVNPCPEGEPFDSPACGQVGPDEIHVRDVSCAGADDVATAVVGMRLEDVWVTRLEANLPREALDTDLVITASQKQTPVENALVAPRQANVEAACPSFAPPIFTQPRVEPPKDGHFGLYTLALGAAALAWAARRLGHGRLGQVRRASASAIRSR